MGIINGIHPIFGCKRQIMKNSFSAHTALSAIVNLTISTLTYDAYFAPLRATTGLDYYFLVKVYYL
jgi:hypothetical protein